jgi:ABC-type transporter MlaC component
MMRSGAIAIAVLLAIASPAAAGCPAAGFVSDAGYAIMGAARTGSPKAFTRVAARYTNLESLALFALGKYRDRLPKSQRAEYVTLTRDFIGRFLAKHAERFRSDGMKITECSGNDSKLMVSTRLSGGQRVVFRLYKARGGYRVQDLSVSSVWLGQQLRSTFVGVISRNGGDVSALLRYLRS